MTTSSKRIVKYSLICIMVLLCLLISTVSVSAATYSGIKSVNNVTSGIQVKWNKDTSKTGYIVYKKTGTSSTWKKVHTVSKNTVVSWTDKDVTNGTKYTYKVYAKKGTSIVKNSDTKKTYRLNKAKIDSLNADQIKGFTVKSVKNAKATGFQVKYSKYSGMSSARTKKVSGTTLKKSFDGLTSGKTYYVKIRAYKNVNGVTYFGPWSDKKSVTVHSYFYAYPTAINTYMYKQSDYEGTSTAIWYKSKIKVYGTARTTSKGAWKKIKYKDKTGYIFVESGKTAYTKVKPTLTYKYSSNSDLQQQVVDEALRILKNYKTKYDYSHKFEFGTKDSDGKYPFDCSGYATYVINKIMQKSCPAYKLPSATKSLYQADNIINDGIKGELNCKTVCKGTVDFSKIKPGDILFFNSDDGGASDSVNHCAIYLGNKEFIQCTKIYGSEGGVCIAPLAGKYKETFISAIRVIPTKFVPAEISKNVVKKAKLYSARECKAEDYTGYDAPAGSKITILYTIKIGSNVNAYVKCADGKKGYIWNYKNYI